jgi:hypothetical protein
MGDLVVKAFLAYVEKNPEVIERLIELLVKSIVDHLSKSK